MGIQSLRSVSRRLVVFLLAGDIGGKGEWKNLCSAACMVVSLKAEAD